MVNWNLQIIIKFKVRKCLVSYNHWEIIIRIENNKFIGVTITTFSNKAYTSSTGSSITIAYRN